MSGHENDGRRKASREKRARGGGFAGEPVKPKTIAELVDYLKRLGYAGQLRGIAVAYVDPLGQDWQLMACAHLDIQAANALGKGLSQLAAMLERDALD